MRGIVFSALLASGFCSFSQKEGAVSALKPMRQGAGKHSRHNNQPPRKLLKKIWQQYNESHYFDHWLEYADHYQDHLRKLETSRKESGIPISPGSKIKMLEFGVQSGGSARLWKQFYGEDLYYVGMDIDKRTKRSQSPSENIFIEIGSQLDSAAILAVCAKYGPFDVVIDDGGHTAEMMKTTMDTVFPNDACMKHRSLLVIEDMHTMVKGHWAKNMHEIPNLASEVFRKMHYYWANGLNPALQMVGSGWSKPSEKVWADRTEEVALYDSMMFITRGDGPGPLKRLRKGTDRFEYDDAATNKPGAYDTGPSGDIYWYGLAMFAVAAGLCFAKRHSACPL